MFGGIIRAIGAGKEVKRLQKQVDSINPVRPTYEMPEEMARMLESAYGAAQGDMPSYGRTMGAIKGSTADQLAMSRNYADSGSSMLNNLALAGEGERRAIGDLNMSNAMFRQNNLNSLQQALMQVAGYRDQEFQFNEAEPYMQQEADKRAYQEQLIAQKQAKRDSWASVVDGVVNSALTIGTAGIGGGQTLFGKLFGKMGTNKFKQNPTGIMNQNSSNQA